MRRQAHIRPAADCDKFMPDMMADSRIAQIVKRVDSDHKAIERRLNSLPDAEQETQHLEEQKR